MRKPNFSVTVLTLTVLTIAGALLKGVSPLVPENSPNELLADASPFLKQASRSGIRWETYRTESFARARRENKPIMIVVGLPESSLGRKIEKNVFDDPDAIAFLNRNFVCIRIDGMLNPEWLSYYLPLSRTRIPLRADYQIWFLDSEGRYSDHASPLGTTSEANWFNLQQHVLRVLETSTSNAAKEPSNQDLDRREILEATPSREINLDAQIRAYRSYVDPKTGGFRYAGRLTLLPQALRFVLLLGDQTAFKTMVDPILKSYQVDWLDDGFFSGLLYYPKAGIEYEKNTLFNAELMVQFAIASVLFRDANYREQAIRCFDYLQSQINRQGVLWHANYPVLDPAERSYSQSFTERQIRSLLNSKQIEFARSALGLDPGSNPSMTIRIPDQNAIRSEPELAESIISTLSKNRRKPVTYVEGKFLETHAFVAKNMLNVAVLLDDRDRLEQANSLYSFLQSFRVADDVLRTTDYQNSLHPCLRDYLAYADAALMNFQSTGNVLAYEDGLRVFQRAVELFYHPENQIWQTTYTNPMIPGPQAVDVPELLDSYVESSTAQAIRLSHRFGLLCLHSNDPETRKYGSKLIETSVNSLRKIAGLSQKLAIFGSGFFNSAVVTQRNRLVVTIGPDAVLLSNQLRRKNPFVFVIPATSAADLKLSQTKPGVYLLDATKVFGPFTVDVAASEILKS